MSHLENPISLTDRVRFSHGGRLVEGVVVAIDWNFSGVVVSPDEELLEDGNPLEEIHVSMTDLERL